MRQHEAVAQRATTTALSREEEATLAREQVAQRLERLAGRIRRGSTMDIAALDTAYAEIVKLAGTLAKLEGLLA